MSSPVQDERDINRDHLITIDRSEGIDQRPIDEREQEKKKATLSAESGGKFLSLVASNPVPSAAPPRNEPQPLPPTAHALVERIQKDIDRQHGKAKTQLAALERKIEAQEKKCVAPKIDEEIQKIRF